MYKTFTVLAVFHPQNFHEHLHDKQALVYHRHRIPKFKKKGQLGERIYKYF